MERSVSPDPLRVWAGVGQPASCGGEGDSAIGRLPDDITSDDAGAAQNNTLHISPSQRRRESLGGSEIGRPLDYRSDQTPLVLRSSLGKPDGKSMNDPDYRRGMLTSVPEAGRATFLVFVKCRPRSMNGFSINRVER